MDTYYVTLKEIIINADKRGEIDYDEVQDQMKAIYKRLKKAKKSNLEIFNEISEKVHKVSLPGRYLLPDCGGVFYSKV